MFESLYSASPSNILGLETHRQLPTKWINRHGAARADMVQCLFDGLKRRRKKDLLVSHRGTEAFVWHSRTLSNSISFDIEANVFVAHDKADTSVTSRNRNVLRESMGCSMVVNSIRADTTSVIGPKRCWWIRDRHPCRCVSRRVYPELGSYLAAKTPMGSDDGELLATAV